MTPSLSKRLDGVSESATLRLNAKVQELKAAGKPVINLTAGEPDFNVPDPVKQAVIDAVHQNQSKYTPVPGIMKLREAIAEKTNRDQPSLAAKKPWAAKNVIVTNGGKQALSNFFFATLNPGDEVLIPSPFWVSYPEMVMIAGGVPKLVPSTFESGFKINPGDLRRAITPRTKVLVLNSPSNPTGVMYSKEELKKLGEVLKAPGAEQIWIVSDEIYDRIILGDLPFCSFGEACPDLGDRIVTVGGLSKSAAMTGWRVGWSVASVNVTQAMNTLQGQSTSGINAPAQWAAIASLKLPEKTFELQQDIFKRRLQIALEILSKSAKIKWVVPAGSFYLFVGVGEDSVSFCERLLEQALVAVVPGEPFGEKEFVRISFATDDQTLRQGLEKLVKFTG